MEKWAVVVRRERNAAVVAAIHVAVIVAAAATRLVVTISGIRSVCRRSRPLAMPRSSALAVDTPCRQTPTAACLSTMSTIDAAKRHCL